MAEAIEFENFLIDTNAFELRRSGDLIAVEPLVLDLIIEMARQPGVLRTRDDLIETVWNGRIVSDTTISTAIKSARKALGDTDVDKRIIRTVRGRGFQFICETSAGHLVKETAPTVDIELPVLSLQVVALDDTISKSMAHSLEGRLRAIFGRIPYLSISATALTATVPATEGRIGTPTHLIEVVLSSIEETIFADVTLSDLDSGLQKWARHISVRSQEGIEKLLAEIGPKAEPQILKETAAFLSTRNQDEPRALVLTAMQTIAERGWNPNSIATANDLLIRAIDQDPEIPLAYAIMSLLNAIGYRVGILRHDDGAVTRAIDNAEKALAMESQNSSVLGLTGCALCDVGQLARGEPIIDRAIDLDPMNGHAYAAKGAALMMKGNFNEALHPLRRSIEISPADSRLAVWGAILAVAEMRCGQLDEAQASAELAVSRDDVNYLSRLAAVAIHLAREDMATFKVAIAELLRVHPDITSNEILFFVGKSAKEAIWPAIETTRERIN